MRHLASSLLALLFGFSSMTAAADTFELPNGLRVSMQPLPGAGRVAFLLRSQVGPDDMGCDRLQLPHLVEHLAFTAVPGLPQGDAMGWFRREAGSVNGATSPRTVSIHGAVHADRLLAALETVRAMVVWRDELIGMLPREKEMLRLEEGDGRVAYWIGQRYSASEHLLMGHDPRRCGRDRTLADAGIDEVRAAWQDIFDPRNLSLVLAGDFDAASARARVETVFGALPRHGRVLNAKRLAPAAARIDVATWTPRVRSSVGVVIPFRDNVDARLAGRVLAEWLNVTLYERIRLEMGASYHVAATWVAADGAVHARIIPDEGRLDEAVAALSGVLAEARGLASDDEGLRAARRQVALRDGGWATDPEYRVRRLSPALIDETHLAQELMVDGMPWQATLSGAIEGEPVIYTEQSFFDRLINTFLGVALFAALAHTLWTRWRKHA